MRAQVATAVGFGLAGAAMAALLIVVFYRKHRERVQHEKEARALVARVLSLQHGGEGISMPIPSGMESNDTGSVFSATSGGAGDGIRSGPSGGEPACSCAVHMRGSRCTPAPLPLLVVLGF